MNSNKKRLYLGVVLLGGLALAVDRFVLTDAAGLPASAQADSSVPVPSTASGAPEGEVAALSIPQLHFPRLMPEVDLGREMRDVFTPPAHYLTPKKDTQSGPDNTQSGLSLNGTPQKSKAQAFADNHVLTAVMIQPRLRLAIVDDVWVSIGQTVDDCVLRRVESGSAVFECSDGEAVLQVLEPARLLGD